MASVICAHFNKLVGHSITQDAPRNTIEHTHTKKKKKKNSGVRRRPE